MNDVNELPGGSDATLEPVRFALLAEARSRAEGVRAAADAQAEQRRAAARAEAAELLAAARELGAESAQAAAQAHTVRARREARGLRLAVQRELYQELGVRAREAVARLREEPDYPEVLRRLGELARAALGPGTVVVEHPAGGVVGTCDGRSIDLTLPTLATRALDGLGAEVAALWASSPG